MPSNVFLKRLRPSIWLSLLMFLWGIMMVRPAPSLQSHEPLDLTICAPPQTVQGLVHNYGGLLGPYLASKRLPKWHYVSLSC